MSQLFHQQCKRRSKLGACWGSKRRAQDLIASIEGELTVDADVDLTSAFLELPGVEAAVSGQTQVDAVVRCLECSTPGRTA